MQALAAAWRSGELQPSCAQAHCLQLQRSLLLAQPQPVLGMGDCVSKIDEYTQSGFKVLVDVVYIAKMLLDTSWHNR